MKTISISTWPAPLHASQRPPATLKEKWPAPYPRSRATGCSRQDAPHLVPRLDVGHGVRARRAPDGRLVHQHHARPDARAPSSASYSPTASPRCSLAVVSPPQLPLRGAVEHVVDQRGLARAGDARDHGERAQGDLHVDARGGCADGRPGARATARPRDGACVRERPRRSARTGSDPWPCREPRGRREALRTPPRPPCSPEAGPSSTMWSAAQDGLRDRAPPRPPCCRRPAGAAAGRGARPCPGGGARWWARPARRACPPAGSPGSWPG